MRNRIVISCAGLWLLCASILAAEPGAQFAKANQEYAAGDFKTAIDDYEELVRSGQDTPNLFYNLGNAYFRKNDFGRAILSYERALALDPHHPEAEANLRIARDEARALELVPNRWERIFAFADENQYALAASISFWIGILSVATWVLGRGRGRGAIALSILSLSIFVIAVGASYELSRGKNGRELAVVTGDKVEARLATAENANRVLTLPAGSEIKIVSQRGWIPSNSAEQVRL